MSWAPLRISLQVVSIALLLAAIILTTYAVVTVRWQELDITEFKVFHAHGLWKDCWVSTADPTYDVRGNLVENRWKCTYKFNQDDPHEGHNHGHGPVGGHRGLDDGQEIQHLNLDWHKWVFGLLVAAVVVGLVALLFAFCSFWKRLTAIIWAILALVAACLAAAAIIIFFRQSHDKDYRFVHFHGKIYEQEVGESFWVGLAGAVAFLLATIFAILSAVVLFVTARNDHVHHTPHKNWPKHHTAV